MSVLPGTKILEQRWCSLTHGSCFTCPSSWVLILMFCGSLIVALGVLKFVTQNFCNSTQNRGTIIVLLQFFLRNSVLRSCFQLPVSKSFC